jgi:hypothetical protein
MGNRLVLAMVAAVVLVAVGGIGFAAFTATATVNGTATGGTAELYWSGSPAVYTSGYVMGCAPSFSGSPATVMTLAPTGFAPGDYCQVYETLVNGGNVGVTLSSAPTITGISGGSGCTTGEWTISDNSGAAPALAPGNTYSFEVTVSLNSGVTNECQGATASISDVVTGTSFA